MKKIAVIVAILWPLAATAEINGPAKVIDGNTLVVAGQKLRLWGSDAPDLAQNCSHADGRRYSCGNIARTALMDLVLAATLRCRPRGPAATVPISVSCTVQGADVAANMVHTGWAVANRAEMPGYATIEKKSRAAGRGMWRGAFERPADWRRRAGGTRETMCVRGKLTDEGVECQAMRGDDGTLYTFTRGQAGDARTGDSLCVCGSIAGMSFCMQGRTIAVTRILGPAECP